MGKLKSASDYIPGAVNYATGLGYYTTHTAVSDLLQCAAFGAGTTPTNAVVGDIIKRTEGKIDDKIKVSHRAEIIENEVHDFSAGRLSAYPVIHFKDYVGWIKLDSEKVRKIVRLEVYQGDEFIDIASASVKYTPPETSTTDAFTLTLTVGPVVFVLTENSTNGFYDHLGQKTTVLQICSAINETFPHKTSQFTGETAAKSTSAASPYQALNISDFYYASPTEDGKTVVISSLLPGDSGSVCTLVETIDSVASPTQTFTDNENYGRENDYWYLGDEGRVFFRQKWPYYHNHSIKVTYIRGASRVPSSIHEAATKLVAAEILLNDDNTILIAETGANIDLRAKHDILKEEANKILESKQTLLHLID